MPMGVSVGVSRMVLAAMVTVVVPVRGGVILMVVGLSAVRMTRRGRRTIGMTAGVVFVAVQMTRRRRLR